MSGEVKQSTAVKSKSKQQSAIVKIYLILYNVAQVIG